MRRDRSFTAFNKKVTTLVVVFPCGESPNNKHGSNSIHDVQTIVSSAWNNLWRAFDTTIGYCLQCFQIHIINTPCVLATSMQSCSLSLAAQLFCQPCSIVEHSAVIWFVDELLVDQRAPSVCKFGGTLMHCFRIRRHRPIDTFLTHDSVSLMLPLVQTDRTLQGRATTGNLRASPGSQCRYRPLCARGLPKLQQS